MTLSKKKNTEIAEIVAKNIKNRRLSLEMSRETLAKGAKLDVSTLSLVESGKRWPSAECVERIARALGVTAWSLYIPSEME